MITSRVSVWRPV